MKRRTILFYVPINIGGLILMGFGASAAVVAPGWQCGQANESVSNVEQVVDLVNVCQIKSVEKLIPLLPSETHRQFALAYRSRSPMPGSFDHPRVIKYTKSGLALTYNGSPDQARFNSVEMLSFESSQRKFHFKKIEFAADGLKPAVVGPTNPAACLGCHGQDPHPNFDNAIWPGFYGSLGNAQLIKPEAEHFASFLSKVPQNPRYADLEIPPSTLAAGSLLSENLFSINRLLFSLNGQKIAHELRQVPELHPFRYALVGVMNCGFKPADLIRGPWQNKFSPTAYEALAEATVQLQIQSELSHFDRQRKILGSNDEGAGLLASFKNPTPALLRQLRDSYSSLIGVRLIVEGLGHDLSHAAASLETRYYTMEADFFDQGHGISGSTEFYRELLDPIQDELIFRPDPDCRRVKELSLAETGK